MQTIFIHILSGSITNKQVIREAFKGLGDGCWKVEIHNAKKRSLSQNKYLHGVLIPMVFDGLRNAGFNEVRDHEDAKMVIKELFLKKKIVNEVTGDVLPVTRDTRSLTTAEMNVFIEEVIQWAQQYLNVSIPYPGSAMLINF